MIRANAPRRSPKSITDMTDTPHRMVSTLPPPGGAEDLYSACTVVGPASAALLDLVRRAEEDEAKVLVMRPELVRAPEATRPPIARATSASARIRVPSAQGTVTLQVAVAILFPFAAATFVLAALAR